MTPRHVTFALSAVICVAAASAYPFMARKAADVEAKLAVGLTAQQKQGFILAAVDSDEQPWPYPTDTIRECNFDMNVTFDHVSDQMPAGRVKYIHPRGYVGGFKFVPNPSSPYTGGFQGAEYGIVRFSHAAEPSAAGLFPASAWKFLRAGAPSANMFAMPGLALQTSHNFFDRPFSNYPPHPAPAPPNPFTTCIADSFLKAAHCIHVLGLWPVATMMEDGTPVESPKQPFQVLLQPRVSTPDVWPQNYTKPFEMFEAGTTMMDVFAREYPDSDPEPIGELVLTTGLTTTLYGDKKLFFQHNRFSDDILHNPDWALHGLNISEVCYV